MATTSFTGSTTAGTIFNTFPNFDPPPVSPPPPPAFTAYRVDVSAALQEGHTISCTCQLCGHCILGDIEHPHVPMVGDITSLPMLPKGFLQTAEWYCPKASCFRWKPVPDIGWEHYPRTFTRRSSLTQHINNSHPELVLPGATLPDLPDPLEFCETMEQAQALSAILGPLSRIPNAPPTTTSFLSDLGTQDITSRLSSIYIGLELALDNPQLQPIVDVEVERTMTDILNYFCMSTLGESRYLCELMGDSTRRSSLAMELNELLSSEEHTELNKPFTVWLAMSLALRDSSRRTTRYQMWNVALDVAKIVGYDTLLESLSFIFNLEVWGHRGSIGGRKWASVARHGLKFIHREESPIMALDSIVDVVHNGGWALNKYYHAQHHCDRHRLELKDALDMKVESAMKLLPLACLEPWLKGALVDGDLFHSVLRYLPIATPRQKWEASEVAARLSLRIPDTISRDSVAHMECSPIWATHGGLESWLTIYGDDSIPYDSGSYKLWLELAERNSNQPPSFAEYKQWYNAVSTLRAAGNSWQHAMVDVLSNYPTLPTYPTKDASETEHPSDAPAPVQQEAPQETPLNTVPIPAFGHTVKSKSGSVLLLEASDDPNDD